MKICFISRSAYPLFNQNCKATFGGAEVDFYLIATELAKDSRFDVNFIVGDFGQKEKEIYANVKLYKSYKFDEKKFIQMKKLVEVMRKVDADVYFQEGASGGTGVISMFCKFNKKVFVYRTASDIDCDGTFIKKKKLEGRLYLYGLKNADIVITQNIKNKKQLIQNHNLKSIIIKNATEIPSFKKNKKEYTLWVGRSEKLKQPNLFLEIASLFPDEKFLMISPKANYNNVEGLEKNARRIKNLKFIRNVPFSKIDNYFKNAKIFVNTSEYEGFPNTFVQATKFGVPILSLNVNPDNFINKYECGFYAKRDFEKLKKSLHKFFADKYLRNKLSRNAYIYSKKNHDIKSISSQYKKSLLNLK